MFIGPCIIVIVEELKTNLMSLVSASTCKTYTTKHHPQQTPTQNEKRKR